MTMLFEPLTRIGGFQDHFYRPMNHLPAGDGSASGTSSLERAEDAQARQGPRDHRYDDYHSSESQYPYTAPGESFSGNRYHEHIGSQRPAHLSGPPSVFSDIPSSGSSMSAPMGSVVGCDARPPQPSSGPLSGSDFSMFRPEETRWSYQSADSASGQTDANSLGQHSRASLHDHGGFTSNAAYTTPMAMAPSWRSISSPVHGDFRVPFMHAAPRYGDRPPHEGPSPASLPPFVGVGPVDVATGVAAQAAQVSPVGPQESPVAAYRYCSGPFNSECRYFDAARSSSSRTHGYAALGDGQGYPDQSYLNPFEVKHRRRTTKSQFRVLENTFLKTPKPSADVRRAISEQLDMPPRAVQIWFQNRRAKAKTAAKKAVAAAVADSERKLKIEGGSPASTSTSPVSSALSRPVLARSASERGRATLGEVVDQNIQRVTGDVAAPLLQPALGWPAPAAEAEVLGSFSAGSRRLSWPYGEAATDMTLPASVRGAPQQWRPSAPPGPATTAAAAISELGGTTDPEVSRPVSLQLPGPHQIGYPASSALMGAYPCPPYHSEQPELMHKPRNTNGSSSNASEEDPSRWS